MTEEETKKITAFVGQLTEENTKLKSTIAQLESERDFAIEYLNPADTSFRQMIDTFRTLSKDQQDKLIDLSRSLKALTEKESE